MMRTTAAQARAASTEARFDNLLSTQRQSAERAIQAAISRGHTEALAPLMTHDTSVMERLRAELEGAGYRSRVEVRRYLGEASDTRMPILAIDWGANDALWKATSRRNAAHVRATGYGHLVQASCP